MAGPKLTGRALAFLTRIVLKYGGGSGALSIAALNSLNQDLGETEPMDAETEDLVLGYNRGLPAPKGCLCTEGYAALVAEQGADDFASMLTDMRTIWSQLEAET